MAMRLNNRLKIHCEDSRTMERIKLMIFDEDENKNQIYTMQKMLPKPKWFSGSSGYYHYGYEWCYTIWGTNLDAYDCNIIESGNDITIYYSTVWNPNNIWAQILCVYLNETLSFRRPEDIPPISITLQYYDYHGDFGGIFEWVPFTNPTNTNYSFMEYAKLHDKEMYERFIDKEEVKSGNNDINAKNEI